MRVRAIAVTVRCATEGNVRRCTLLPDEIARLFMDHLSRQWLLGIFLSSGIVGTPDRTMERLTAAAEILRREVPLPRLYPSEDHSRRFRSGHHAGRCSWPARSR